MAGVKGRSGGARPGAGRPRKKVVEERLEPQLHGGALKRAESKPIPQEETDMLTLLQNVALGRTEATALQVRAAIAAVQYTHTKKSDGGKKDEQENKAKKVSGKFAPAAIPRLIANAGRRV